MENISAVGRYPDTYYDPLRNAIASYACCAPEHLVLGSGSSDLLRLFVALLAPKKALLPIPSATDYEHVLSVYGCETDFYELDINQDYHLDMDDFIAHLSDTYDIVILGNPNNPTSQLISKADIEKLAAACKELGIALLLDEMYIEFTENYERNTAISLVNTYDNLIILRSVSKFFSVPGLRLAYAIMNNETNMTIINMTATPNSISCLTAAACYAGGYRLHPRIALPHLYRAQPDLRSNEYKQESAVVQTECKLRADADSKRGCHCKIPAGTLQSEGHCPSELREFSRPGFAFCTILNHESDAERPDGKYNSGTVTITLLSFRKTNSQKPKEQLEHISVSNCSF
jgi:aspartate/methionine/tyrosine aminotransferase